MTDKHGPYTTYREIVFLDGLGRWARHAGNPQGTTLSRRELLWNYYSTLEKRALWGHIDPEEVMDHVQRLLRGEGI